jgi:hypothetical protein
LTITPRLNCNPTAKFPSDAFEQVDLMATFESWPSEMRYNRQGRQRM